MNRRDFVRNSLRIVVKLSSKVDLRGIENIPDEPLILAINHISLIDSVLVFTLVPIENMTAVVADKWVANPWVGWMVRWINGISINRENPDRQSIRQVVNFLKAGGAVGVAPEGTRSKTGGLQRPKPGIAYMAHKGNAAILPIGISGQQQFFKKLLSFKRPHIVVNIGSPIRLTPLQRGTDKTEQLKQQTDEIMFTLADLLPPEMRGVYATDDFAASN